MIAWAVTDLPRAGLAEHGQGLAGVEVVRDAVDHLGDAVAGAELHVQVADLEQVTALGRPAPALLSGSTVSCVMRTSYRSFGSKASRTASPSMMNASTVRARNADGHDQRDGRSRMCSRPASMSMPQEMVGALQADAEEGQRRLGRDERAERDGEHHDHRGERVRQDVPQHDPAVAGAEHPGRRDVVLLLGGDHRGPDDPGRGRPAEQRRARGSPRTIRTSRCRRSTRLSSTIAASSSGMPRTMSMTRESTASTQPPK